MPACMRVSNLLTSGTLSNPESHSHLSLVDVITVTFNMAVTMKIVVPAGSHVERTVNGPRRATLGAIEGEIPTTTAVIASSNPEVTSKVNMEGSICEVLHKFTVLPEIIMIINQINRILGNHFQHSCNVICLYFVQNN